jgi:hypothetical protein
MALILRWCIAGRIMSLLNCWFPLTHITGVGTVDLYLAEHPGGLVIPASRKRTPEDHYSRRASALVRTWHA